MKASGWLAVLVFGVALLVGSAAPQLHAQDSDGESAVVEDLEPVNVNQANVDDLLEIPGMDPDLARAIVAYKREAGPVDSVEALVRSPLITPSRLLAVRPWLTAERTSPDWGGALSATVRSGTTSRKEEMKVLAGRGAFGFAARLRRTAAAEESAPAAWSAVVRVRPAPGVTIVLGDQAPIDGLGLLIGVTSRPGVRGALSAREGTPWRAEEESELRRSAPTPDNRRLRGASLGLGRHLTLGAFRYDAGLTTFIDESDEPAPAARVLLFGLSAAGVSARAFLHDGRPWVGARSGLTLAKSRVTFEAARDPLGRHRYALAVESAPRSPVTFRFSRIAGAPLFVNPLGADSEKAPASAEQIETGRNENRNETALFCRARPLRRMAVELEVRSAVDRATARRGWDRPVGTGIARVELSPGGGWSLNGETRVENRGAPGPSSESDAPVRRHSGKLVAGWSRARAHVRLEWQGRFEIETPPGGTAAAPVGGVQDLLSARGRWPLSRVFSIAGGVAHYRLPPSAPLVLYEERPAGLPPAVFVRGAEQRLHLALAADLRALDAGVFLARRRPLDFGSPSEVSWGLSLALKTGGR